MLSLSATSISSASVIYLSVLIYVGSVVPSILVCNQPSDLNYAKVVIRAVDVASVTSVLVTKGRNNVGSIAFEFNPISP